VSFARRIDDALEKIDLALYQSAAVLLRQAFAECDAPEVWERNWALVSGLINTLLLSGQSAEMNGLLLKLQAQGGTRNLDIRISSQLAAFYSLLDSEGDRSVLDATLQELELLDRQDRGRYRAGVLSAQGVLAAQCGHTQDALEYLERAWAHSQSLGGFCTHQAICEILRLGLASQNWQFCRAWRAALSEAPSKARCCNVRSAIARAESAMVMDDTMPPDALYTLLAVLGDLECPDLVVRGCAAVLRLASRHHQLTEAERKELGDSAIVQGRKVNPSQRYVFERALAEIDLLLFPKLSRKRLTVEFEYSPLGVFLRVDGQPRGTTPRAAVVNLTQREEVDEVFGEAKRQADKLDERLGGSGFMDLVANREAVLLFACHEALESDG
jgi:hypothetical protein